MSFDLQLGMLLLAIAAAVLRRRLNILIFSINHLIVVRAFQNIDANGQPANYQYLPAAMFSRSALEEAGWVMGLPTLFLLMAAALPWHVEERAKPLPPLPKEALAVLAGYFTFIFFTTRTILTSSYSDADHIVGGTSAGGGIYVLAWALATFELRRRVDAGQLTPARGLGVVLLGTFLLDFIKGSTGLASGIVLAASFLVFLPTMLGESRGAGTVLPDRRQRIRAAVLAVFLLGLVASMAVFVRQTRTRIATMGVVDAAVASFESVSLLGSTDQSEGIESTANGTQGAAHVLMCQTLYDLGYDREWRSIWGPIEYTFKPQILMGPLGLTRSREAAWELSDYFVHGGGINVFGEFYWNGGFLCTVLMGAGLIFFLMMVDVRARSSWFWFALACAIGPGLVQGYGYGYAQVFRGVANGFLFFLPFAYYLQYAEDRRGKLGMKVQRPSAEQAPRGMTRPVSGHTGA